MKPSLQAAWPTLRQLVNESAYDVVIASVNDDGSPHITPIGSIFLRDDCTGYYLERFPAKLRHNIQRDERICLYARSSKLRLWLGAFLFGRMSRPGAVRLIGRAGERRPITETERGAWLRKVRPLRWSRGYQQLWADMTHVRELVFDDFVPVKLGAMSRGHWQSEPAQLPAS